MSDTAPVFDINSQTAVLATGARVLRTEGEALLLFAGSLDENFVRAVELIHACTGRVILSGMGKSGHIARKIAATLASTGTPSFFVHPAEASHGDLGMITPDDICIVLSNSGETSELSDILGHTRRFGIPLIGVASRPGSTLLTTADVPLLLPNAPEACAIGMAPTTSTTMTLALGDALAVAVMEKKGFQPTDFKVFHPGGKLGAQLLTVSALMHKGDDLPLIGEGAPMSEALLVMTAKSFGVVGVCNGGALTGIITDGDLRRHMDGLMTKRAADVMHRGPRTIAAGHLAVEALGVMNDRKITCLFVVDETKTPVGLIHIHDCLRAGVA
ncbi:arabinose 5-phosphate isomerase [Asticcacaulis biprosthecium C19]|uniref:Arabinose 5-phosphate isomerase n=1 Tax=Asticcacaulis biprosthecium C19 TaxID=715226 RepID=F4QGM8_9CAUL|nr:KpsF/GutQ family sugar-phosphate isomerase [Asticcacaulis biprosthecium]EGF92480.1 arabinose 5-phosphate isomerase [Asticcacaulis biprosthecium C19]